MADDIERKKKNGGGEGIGKLVTAKGRISGRKKKKSKISVVRKS